MSKIETAVAFLVVFSLMFALAGEIYFFAWGWPWEPSSLALTAQKAKKAPGLYRAVKISEWSLFVTLLYTKFSK